MRELGVLAICLLVIVGSCGCLGTDDGTEDENGDGNGGEKNQPPTASALATPLGGCEPLKVSFTGIGNDSDGSIVSYHWDFKDGSTSDQQNPTHTFHATGTIETETYEATLTVTDDGELTATDKVTITVLLDTDGDGEPDIYDIDDDNDGYLDTEDLLSKQDAKIKITLEKFRVIDEVDGHPNHLNAQVFFKIYMYDDYKIRMPSGSGNFLGVDIGELRTINWVYTYNCPDDKKTHKINIRMYDEDGWPSDELLDIDGHDGTKGLTVYYDIQTGTWSGDDTDGETNGSDDGTWYTDDNDAYLKYNIEIV